MQEPWAWLEIAAYGFMLAASVFLVMRGFVRLA